MEEVKTSLDCPPPHPSPFFPDAVWCLLSPPGHAWYISSPFLLSSLLFLFHAVWLELCETAFVRVSNNVLDGKPKGPFSGRFY